MGHLVFRGDRVHGAYGAPSSVRLLPPNLTRYLSTTKDGALLFRGVQATALGGSSGEKVLSVCEDLHRGKIEAIVVEDEGKCVITGGEDGLVRVWRVRRAPGGSPRLDERFTLTGHCAPISCLAASSSQGIVVSGDASGTVLLFDLGRGRYIRTIARGGAGQPAALHVAVNESNGDILTVAGAKMSYWHLNGTLLASVDLLSAPSAVCVTNCPEWQHGVCFVTGHESGHVALWDLLYPGDVVRAPEAYPQEVTVVGKALGTGEAGVEEEQRELVVNWPLPSKIRKRCVLQSGTHAHSITALAVSADGRQLASGDAAGKVTVWLSADAFVAGGRRVDLPHLQTLHVAVPEDVDV